MKRHTTQSGKKGGLLDGPSHENGGIPVVVKSTNQPIEVEGGEIIINKEASKKHCKLLSQINQSAGNGIEIPCDCEDCESKKNMEFGGKTILANKQKEIYNKWKGLVNMSYKELEDFYNSNEGRVAGLSSSEAKEKGIHYGRESARWILKMLDTDKESWTPIMWSWANKQISFISRMQGVKGPLYKKNEKTRKHLALLIWGHNPIKNNYRVGGLVAFEKLNDWAINMLDINLLKWSGFNNKKDYELTMDKPYVKEELIKENQIDLSEIYNILITQKAKQGKFIFPKKTDKTHNQTQPNTQPQITFEDTIIEIEQKYMEGADRILTMASGQEKVTQATRTALIDWIYLPKNNTKVIIAFSGGKDSVAMVLYAFSIGIKKEQIELWHHEIDGHGEELFDWQCTPSYCQAFADHFELPLLFSYRFGGIAREIQRNKETSQDIFFQKQAKGEFYVAKSKQIDKYKKSKNMFPAIQSNLKKRWCSASAKIEVMSKAITNSENFKKGNFVIMTGERRAESTGRSHYNEIEPYANMTQNRRAITWRPIIDFSEKEVWELMKSQKIQPHPCYMLGWGRCSCQLCIFGDGATWKSIEEINPGKIERIAKLEEQNAERGSNIPTLHAQGSRPIGIKEWIKTRKEPKERDETQPINAKTNLFPFKKYDKGHVQPLVKSFITEKNKNKWLAQAQGNFTMPIIVQGDWETPQGAFSKKQCGAN